MVAAAQDSTQQPPQQAASAEDEALKRNTDCVYFLASPLTCKKGNECEYRHSEYARVNPTDCWYWLKGNCLNPKCGFRHPPLDGLLGTQAATSAGSSLPTSQTGINATYNPRKQVAAANATYYPGNQVAATNAIYNPRKQTVPCIFFQNGFCAKGDRCPFSHGHNNASNKVPQAPAAAPVSGPPNFKKTFGGLEKCSHDQTILQANVSKPTEIPPKVKPAATSETATSKNGIVTEKSVLAPTRFNDEVSSHIDTNVPLGTNGNTMISSNHLPQTDVSDDHSLQNGMDADEFYRESSPGFDVLVDDELRDSVYYHDDDQFGRRGHKGRNLDEFDVGGSADYNTVADVDREMFRDPRGFDSYDHMHGQYDWKQRRASSERKSVGSDPLERRGYRKAEKPDRMEESDLRHRLSKKRRVNGLRSVISQDYAPDNPDVEQSYQSSKDSCHLPPHENSLSSRLRGRIKIPGRSSPVNDNDLHSERDLDRGRNFGRLPPGMTQSSSHQGRLQDRIKGRVQEDFYNDERSFKGSRTRRDILNDVRCNFSGPKSLAELKVSKSGESKEQQMEGQESFSIGKRKNLKIEGHQPSECDLSFEGPKPLSEILKRKRGAEASASGNGTSSGNKEEHNQRKNKERLIGSSITSAVTVTPSVQSSASEKEGNIHVLYVKEDSKSAKLEPVGGVDGVNPTHKSEYGQSSQVPDASELEAEDDTIVEEGMENDELEAYDQRDGEFDYEQVDGGDYDIDEGENADPEEEEYMDDEDADDFDKKIGVMFS